jgi:hypothetical protein
MLIWHLINKLLHKDRWKKQFGSSNVNGDLKVALKVHFKGICNHKDGHEDGSKFADLDTRILEKV